MVPLLAAREVQHMRMSRVTLALVAVIVLELLAYGIGSSFLAQSGRRRGERQPETPPAIQQASVELRTLLRSAFAKLPKVYTEAGTSTIKGKIVDIDTGSPVAGVEVTARIDLRTVRFAASFANRPTPGEMTPEELIDAYVERAASALEMSPLGGQLLSKCTTDAEGNYVLTGLGDFEYDVSVAASGIDFQNNPTKVPPREASSGRYRGQSASASVKAGGVQNFWATMPPGVRLTVLMPDGTPTDNVHVWWTACPPGMEDKSIKEILEASRDGSGRTLYPLSANYPLSPGVYVFQAAPQRTDNDSLLGPGQALVKVENKVVSLEIRLTKVPGVMVTVENLTEHWDVSEAEIYCVKVKDDFDIGSWTRSMIYPDRDEDGVGFVTVRRLGDKAKSAEDVVKLPFRNVKPGKNVIVALMDNELIAHVFVDVKEGVQHEGRLQIFAPERNTFAEVVVTGPEGDVIGDRVLVEAMVTQDGYTVARSTFRGKTLEGTWLIAHPVVDSEGRKDHLKWSVRVTHPQYGSLSRPYEPAAASTVRIKFQVPAFLKVAIKDLATNPAKDVLLVRERMPLDGSLEQEKLAPVSRPDGVNGPFFVGPIQPGPFQISVVLVGKYDDLEIANKSVTATSGEAEMEVEVPELFALEVLLDGVNKESRIELELVGSAGGDSWRSASSVTNSVPMRFEVNKVVFPFLPAKSYRVRWIRPNGQGFGSEVVTLAKATTLDLNGK